MTDIDAHIAQIRTALDCNPRGPWLPSEALLVAILDERDTLRSKLEQAEKEREELRGKHEYQYLRSCREEKRAIDAEKALADATMSPEVINLVIAAREAWDSFTLPEEEFKALDKALEPFSERVPYENEPEDETTP